MAPKTILFSGYLCDPFDISEEYVAFSWLKILLKKFKVILLTTDAAKVSIKRYYHDRAPENLEIISFTDEFPFKSNRIIRDNLMLGYFFFNHKVEVYLKKHPQVIESCDIIFQKSPESFRYFTSLVDFPKPVYVGPLGGGLKPPSQLKSYFKKEPFLYKLRNLDSFILKLPIYKKQFSKIKKVLVSLDYLDDILPAGYLRNKKILLNTGIDCAEYTQADDKNGKPNILYAGRLTRFKGAELLIKAVDAILVHNFILNIVGDGEERRDLEKLVEKLSLTGKVKFHGFAPPTELDRFFQSASIFCLPTLTESFGIVFLSAMASGLPIITIDNGGPKYLCPGEGAIKISITSEEGIIRSLTESLEVLLTDPGKRKRMGAFNRQYCLEHYDWKILEQKILDFFEEEISNYRDNR